MNHRNLMKRLLENFSDAEIMAIQGSTYFHRDLAVKYAYEGAEFSDGYGNIYPAPLFRVNRKMYVEVWPKIKIGEIEINAPYRGRPERCTQYWVLIEAMDDVRACSWIGDMEDTRFLSSGNCFRSKDDAIAAKNAITKLLSGE